MLYQGKTLYLEDFLIAKSSVQKLGERRLGNQGLGEWVAAYEILAKGLVKQHSLYSRDQLLFSKGLLVYSVHIREDAEIHVTSVWEKAYYLQCLGFLCDCC